MAVPALRFSATSAVRRLVWNVQVNRDENMDAFDCTGMAGGGIELSRREG